jgi:hypothetical protein
MSKAEIGVLKDSVSMQMHLFVFFSRLESNVKKTRAFLLKANCNHYNYPDQKEVMFRVESVFLTC